MSKKKPNPVDVEVGRRIRFERMASGLSQTDLGTKIGVTFQQVQKYEKGTNRVGASRLTQIAKALDVPITAFFENVTDSHRSRSSSPSPTELLTRPHALRLLTAYAALEDSKLRLSIVTLVETISSHRSRAGEG
jgi:transcriptional regulator with XRE-family HTH domain